MNDELETLLLKYLSNQQSLDDVRDWVALNIWAASADEEESAIDLLALELSHLDESDDLQNFRTAVNEMLGKYTVLIDEWNRGRTTTSDSMNDVHRLAITDPLIPQAPILVGPVFA